MVDEVVAGGGLVLAASSVLRRCATRTQIDVRLPKAPSATPRATGMWTWRLRHLRRIVGQTLVRMLAR